MTLLLNLYLGHLLGDFVLQPGRLVVAKRNGIAGLLIHAGIIGASTALILIGELDSLWNIILLAMAAHLAIEVITIRLRDWGHLSGLSVFLIDQSMHILSLVILVALAAPSLSIDTVTTFGIELSPVWTALGCALIGVAFMGSIIIFEVSNTVGPDDWNQDILPYDRARILGLLERSAALLLATMVNPALIVVPFIPRVVVALRSDAAERARQMIVAAIGLAVCVAGWALVMLVALSTNSTLGL